MSCLQPFPSISHGVNSCHAFVKGTLIETAEIWYLVLRAASLEWGYGDLPRSKWEPTFGQSMQLNVSTFYPKYSHSSLSPFLVCRV